jgi:hypothetical protein
MIMMIGCKCVVFEMHSFKRIVCRVTLRRFEIILTEMHVVFEMHSCKRIVCRVTLHRFFWLQLLYVV